MATGSKTPAKVTTTKATAPKVEAQSQEKPLEIVPPVVKETTVEQVPPVVEEKQQSRTQIRPIGGMVVENNPFITHKRQNNE